MAAVSQCLAGRRLDHRGPPLAWGGLGHLLHLWFFASPVLYSYATVTGKARAVLRLNPMSHLLVSYQQMLFDGHFDHWRGLGLTALASVIVFAVGAFLFDRLRDTLAEEV